MLKVRHLLNIRHASKARYWENLPGGCRKPRRVFSRQGYRSRVNALTESRERGCDMGFKVKTLDEIRKEKERRQKLGNSPQSVIQEQNSSQMSKDEAPTTETSMKVRVDVLVSIENAGGWKRSISLKRTSSNAVVAPKVQKFSAIHRNPSQMVTHESDEGKAMEVNKEKDDCMAFKRHNMMCCKNGNLPNNELVEENKDSECQHQNGSFMKPEHFCTETKGGKTSVAKKEGASSITLPATMNAKSATTFSTVDELDELLLGLDGDLCLEEVDVNPDTEVEDLFLELERMLQS